MIMHISRFKRKVILSSFMAQTGVCYVQKLPEFRTFFCMQPAYQIRNLNLLLRYVINTKVGSRKSPKRGFIPQSCSHAQRRSSISITNSSQCPSKLSQNKLLLRCKVGQIKGHIVFPESLHSMVRPPPKLKTLAI